MLTPADLRNIKTQVILALFSNEDLAQRLVLKGGNLLDIVFELSARASVDVDFSIAREFSNLELITTKIRSALEETLFEQGYVVFDFTFREVPPKLSDDMKDFWGGYKIGFKLIDQAKYGELHENLEALRRNAAPVGKNNSTIFHIDISRHEFCDEKEPYEIDGTVVYGYSPTMFICEKLRAVCQQMEPYTQLTRSAASSRARDFVDIHIMSSHYGTDWTRANFHDSVRKIFAKKRVPLQLIGQIRHSREQHADSFLSVQATVQKGFILEPFDFYFDYLTRRCDDLHPLWNE